MKRALIIIALVAVVAIVGLIVLGPKIRDLYTSIGTSLDNPGAT